MGRPPAIVPPALFVAENMERETGIEPATSSFGSWRSTAELLPLYNAACRSLAPLGISAAGFRFAPARPRARPGPAAAGGGGGGAAPPPPRAGGGKPLPYPRNRRTIAAYFPWAR